MSKGHCIMVIDDDTDIRELLYQVLTRKGYEVVTAIGGEQALQLMTKSKPDLIILDYKMPGMNGLEFLKRLRAFETQLPVVLLTGFGDEVVETEAKKLGCYDFLKKGVGLELFIESINKFVEPKRVMAKPHRPTRGLVLVVDDEPDIRDLLKRFLTKKDYEVVVLESAEKALAKIRERKPNLVLMDINLPGLDGLSALKEIKAIDKKISVIMITGNTEVALAKEAVKLGAADYIMKPFNLEYLELSVLTKIFLGES